jgi:hypothetical protein
MVEPDADVILLDAMSVPIKGVPVVMVAAPATAQNTLQAFAVPPITTEPANVKSVLIWKTQTSVGVPVRVSVPLYEGLLV